MEFLLFLLRFLKLIFSFHCTIYIGTFYLLLTMHRETLSDIYYNLFLFLTHLL